jgi:hypothetical protein
VKRSNYILLLSLFSVGAFLWYVCTCNKTSENIALSVFSSGVFAFLVELGFFLNDLNRFSFLRGNWRRKNFFNRNEKTSGIGYDDLETRYSPDKVDPNISLKYMGDGEYHGSANYEEGKKAFIILIDKSNILAASGTYQYTNTKSQSNLPDIGHFDILIDIDKKCMYVTHKNILPNGNAQGTEVWNKAE